MLSRPSFDRGGSEARALQQLWPHPVSARCHLAGRMWLSMGVESQPCFNPVSFSSGLKAPCQRVLAPAALRQQGGPVACCTASC
jgi:hypothetical protein